MATYTETSFNEGPWYHPTHSLNFAFRTTQGITFGADTIKLLQLERDTKIVDAIVTSSVALGGTTAATLRLNDGTTQVNIISAASLVAANTVTRLNVAAALGYIIPTRGFWLELLLTAATNAGEIYVGLFTSNVMFGDEGPLAP